MSALRSFIRLNQTAPVQVFDHPVNLVNFDGVATAVGYLQFHDTATDAVNGAVPEKVIQISAAGPIPSIFATIGPMGFKDGMCVAMSSTRDTLTTIGSAYTFFGEVEEWEYDATSAIESVVQTINEVAGADIALVFADPNLASKIITASIFNNDVAAAYLMLFTVDDPQDGTFPVAYWPLAVEETKKLNFGPDGISFQSQSGTTIHSGCTFVISTTKTVLTRSSAGNCTFNATYR